MTGPDGKNVYGSMRDYYQIMSDGEFDLTGYVVNNDANNDDIPDWIEIPGTKDSYANGSMGTFRSAAISAAQNAGLDVSTPGDNVKLAIIYAGHTWRGESPDGQWDPNGLNPNANYIAGTRYVMGERFAPGAPYNQERPDAIFCGIGIHAHEFGHLLGWPGTYDNTWDLMNGGVVIPWQVSGNDKTATAPAPPNPELRERRGWINFVPITSNVTYWADYDLRDPEVFQIKDSSNPDRYFLVENRYFNAAMTIGGTETCDYNHFLPWRFIHTRPDLPDQGLLVWAMQKGPNACGNNPFYYTTLLEADGFHNCNTSYNAWSADGKRTYVGDSGDTYPGFWDVRVISPWSFPAYLDMKHSPSTRNSLNVGIEIVDIVGSDYMVVDFYYSNPEDASPAKPRFLEVSPSENNHPYLAWEANSEPDLENYIVSRKINEEPWYDIAQLDPVETSFIDYDIDLSTGVEPPLLVSYMVRAEDTQGRLSTPSNIETVSGQKSEHSKGNLTASEQITPGEFVLYGNYPNPFNPATTISFGLPADSRVTLTIYSVTGQKVVTLTEGVMEKGYHALTWNGRNRHGTPVSSGIYLYEVKTDNQRLVGKCCWQNKSRLPPKIPKTGPAAAGLSSLEATSTCHFKYTNREFIIQP